MPLNSRDFERKSVNKYNMKLGINQVVIARFFKLHMNEAYTQKEIMIATHIEYDAAVNTALHSLKLKRLLVCKKNAGIMYWRGTDEILKVCTEDNDINEGKKTDDEDGDSEVTS
jgi:hypothetical protein